jgi:ABC-type antimicrobial peptide transport system permease subunit
MYSLISLFLTCCGLFGMALYATEQRTKEIGIRKVNGATSPQIMLLLNSQFISWIGISFIIAIPITWLLLNRWLENFVYHTDMNIGIYLISGFFVLLITLLTVSWHSYKAASGNPVKVLRSE